jgi:hypothetical protein
LCLPYVWYCHVFHKSVEPVIHSGRRTWVSEVNELRGFWHYWWSGKYTLAGWFTDYKDLAQYEVFAKDDALPFMMLLRSAVLYWVRSVRLCRFSAMWQRIAAAQSALVSSCGRSKNDS